MSKAYRLLPANGGGLRPASLLEDPPPAFDPRHPGRGRPNAPWVSPGAQAEIRTRLEAGERAEAVAAALGLSPETVRCVAKAWAPRPERRS
jgi:hypothetical protein